MNPSRLSPFLVRQLLAETSCSSSLLQAVTCAPTAKRFYRFDRRVNKNGFYVSPQWFNQELLEEVDGKQTASLLRTEGVASQANRLFNREMERQQSTVARIEKIEVLLEKPFPNSKEDVTLMMNQNISTPTDCAKHINQWVTERSALAVVDGNEYWHMHRPLERSCQLRLLHYKHEDTMPVNYAFWRSCSMLLASVVKKAFKEQFAVQILSQPMADLKGGSFVCDASIGNLADWSPRQEELRSLTALLWEECSKKVPFERLQVDAQLAADIFTGDTTRLRKIEESKRDSFVIMRLGEHLDLSDEPFIANTGHISSAFLSAIHPIKATNGGVFYRFQGVAIPSQLKINAYTYTLIRERSKKLNQVGLI